MRHLLPTILLTACACGPASASSFVTLERIDVSPSIIYFGEPAAGAAGAEADPARPPAAGSFAAGSFAQPGFAVVSASIIALGEPDVPLEFGDVAAIGGQEKRPRNPHLPPMVIRGGIFGDPFVRAGGGGEPTGEPPPQESAAVPGDGAGPAQPPEPAEPEPRLPPPAPPTARQE